MSCIAAAVSAVIAAGSTSQERALRRLERRHPLGRDEPVRRLVRAPAGAARCSRRRPCARTLRPARSAAGPTAGSADPPVRHGHLSRPGGPDSGSSRPAVLRVAAGQVLAHGRPRAGPEAGQVGGDLDRAVGGREQGQRQRHPSAGERRVLGHAEHVLHPHRHRRPVGGVVDRRRPARRAASTRPGRAGRARPRAATAAGPAAARRGRGGRGRPGRSRRAGTAPASRRASASSAPIGQVRPRLAERRRAGTPPGPAAASAPSVHGERGRAAVAATRATSAAVVVLARFGRRRSSPSRSASRRRSTRTHELVAVPLQPAVLDDAVEQRRRRRSASTAAPRRMRAPTCACRRGRRRRRTAASASGSSSATHAPAPVRSWNWPGRRACRQAVGEPGEQRQPGPVGIDAVEIEVDAGPPGEVGGPVAQPPDGPPVGAVVAARAGDDGDAQREVGRQLVGPAAHDVALVDERGDDARQRVAGRPATIAGQAGVERAARPSAGRAAVIDAVVVEGAERRASSSARLAPRLRRRRVEERQVARRRAPRRQLEHQPGQVDLGDLGGPVGRPAAVLDLAPQPVGDARLGAPGPPGSLVGRVAADRHRRQARHAGADVEARRPGQPAVDDDPRRPRRSATSRRCRWPARPGAVPAATARARGPARPATARRPAGARRRPARPRPASRSAARRISPMPGRKTSTSPGLVAQRPVTGRRRRPARGGRRAGGAPAHVDGVGAALASTTGTGSPSTPSRRANTAVSAVADIATMRRSGRSVAAASRREGQAEVGRQVALVDLVEDHQRRRRAARGRAAAGG